MISSQSLRPHVGMGVERKGSGYVGGCWCLVWSLRAYIP
jgi:hypothetical protein